MLSFLIVIVATAGIVTLLANRITANRFTYMVSIMGTRQAEHLAPLFANYYAQTGNWEGVETLMAAPYASRGVMHGNETMHSYGAQGMRGNMMMHNMEERIILLDATHNVIADTHHTEHHLPISNADWDKGTPIYVGNKCVGTLISASALGTLTSDQNDFLHQVNLLLLIAAAVAGLAGLLVSGLQARRITAPVRALATAAHRIAAGDLSQRISVTGGDELAEMAAAFNAMATKLEEQHELRHRAMADIAHELRTPLSVLQIDLESLEDGLLQATPETITGLQTEVTHLKRLVADLRLLSSVEAGELHINKEALDLNAWARAVTERIQYVAQEQNIAVYVQTSDAPLPIHGDPQRLSQVLLNLLTNALQHTPAGGMLTLTTRQQDQEVYVSVQDSGEGIPQADLAHIFERFYRADRSRTRHTGGSGLGLSIARSLVEAHGGRIWATSEENNGSTFTFVLPLANAGLC